jgi:hypothetical protein
VGAFVDSLSHNHDHAVVSVDPAALTELRRKRIMIQIARPDNTTLKYVLDTVLTHQFRGRASSPPSGQNQERGNDVHDRR